MKSRKAKCFDEILRESEKLETKNGEFMKGEFEKLINGLEKKYGVFHTHLERYNIEILCEFNHKGNEKIK